MTNISTKNFARLLKAIVLSEHDAIVGITGERGTGKSVLMIRLMLAMLGNTYNMEKHNIYQQKELQEKMELFKPYQCLGVDEAISGLFKRDFAKKEQKNIIKMLNMYRDKYFTMFLTLPNFWDLDSAIRTSMIIKYWVYCYKRGEAFVFTHDKNPGSFDPFNRKLIYAYWKAGKIWKCPYYCGRLVWKNIPESMYEKYKIIKARKRKLEPEKNAENIEKEPEITGFNVNNISILGGKNV